MGLKALELQEFDQKAWGKPYYRVINFDKKNLEADLAQLEGTFIIDAKVDAGDKEKSFLLQSLGFFKNCVQISLKHSLENIIEDVDGTEIHKTLQWKDEIIEKHSQNFNYDRFSLDLRLPKEGHDRLFTSWIKNTLEGNGKEVLCQGQNFVSFKEDGEQLVIDLLSILDKGQGLGFKLLTALNSEALRRGKKSVLTTTETENWPAINLYLKVGYKPSHFTSCFTFIK